MSARHVKFHEGAVEDVRNAVRWYRERSVEIALHFIAEINRAVDTIRMNPERWPCGANNTRRFLLWRFPFAIVYSVEELVTTIWAVAHGSRRPGYWVERVE